MNNLYYIVFDFETGGLKSDYHEAIEIAGKAYHPRTLEPIPKEMGGEFVSLMKPMYPDRLDAKALEVNGRTVEELMKAPDQKVIWNEFINWVGTFNKEGTKWGAPIACGKNIRKFDLLFADELNKKHSPKKDKTVLFNERTQLDLEDFLFHWFENSTDLVNAKTKKLDLKMDTIRPYFGLSMDGAHQAMTDVVQTGELIMRYLKLYRDLFKRVPMRGSCKGV